MSIRRKLTFLLLLMTLIPLAINRVSTSIISRKNSYRLADMIQRESIDSAKHSLLTTTKDFSQLLDAKEASIRLMVRFQAEKIEKLFADAMLAQKEGTKQGQQIVSRQLESITQDYLELRKMSKGVVLRQYVILESGDFLSYPPEPTRESRDLRQTSLYQEMKGTQASEIMSFPPVIDMPTGLTVTVVALPLFYPDGNFAGITGLDLITNDLLEELKLPQRDWQGEAVAMLVKRLGPHSDKPGEIAVLGKRLGSQVHDLPAEIKESLPENGRVRERQVHLRHLEASNPQRLNKIVDQAEAGKSGIEQMPFGGKESIWAYGPARTGEEANEPFLIVIVPKDKVIEKAVQIEKDISESTFQEIFITGIIFIVLVIITALVGIRSAKVVTRPIGQIAEAGIRLSEGNYHSHVEVHTKDELQQLAEVFNEMGPKLLEREKMMHSLAVASEIQQQLLPQAPPVCPGLEVAGESIYCDETGGDYFDYLMLHGEGDDTPRLGVAIGDVSGHGIGAALIMTSVRSVLRSHADEYQDRLDELMILLNRSLTDEAETGRFVTFCFSLFDPKQRTLKWVSAGHDPALYMHRDTDTGQLKIDELPNSGLPLGVIDDADYEAMGPLSLSPGDIVLLGTDGIWETSDTSGSPFGKKRLRLLLLEMHDQSADAIRKAIVQAVTTFRGDGPQLDDVTLVVVKMV